MKRIVMTLAAAVLMGSVAVAQDSEKKGQREGRKFDKTEMIKHRTDEVVKKYGLNDQQAARLLDLNTQYADKMGPGPRGGHRGGRPGMGGPGHHGKDSLKARHAHPETDGTTQASPQQPRDGQKPGKRPELTEEQKAKFEAQRKEREAAMQAYDAELQKIMTADQFKQYQADQKKHAQRGQRPPKRG